MDGQEHEKNIWHQLEGATKVKTIRLQENIGKGWYGHRVYAACSFLVNADIICYLDEDNWIEPNHVESLVEVIKQGNDWAYSLRKIYDKEGNYVCYDNCESLGKWPVFFDESVHHIDTSSFAVKRDVAINIGHSWYGQWGADRKFFFNIAKYFPKYDCNREHTLCYRLDGNENSVKPDFFTEGNKVMSSKYDENSYPWTIKEERLWSPGSPVTLVLT